MSLLAAAVTAQFGAVAGPAFLAHRARRARPLSGGSAQLAYLGGRGVIVFLLAVLVGDVAAQRVRGAEASITPGASEHTGSVRNWRLLR